MYQVMHENVAYGFLVRSRRIIQYDVVLSSINREFSLKFLYSKEVYEQVMTRMLLERTRTVLDTFLTGG